MNFHEKSAWASLIAIAAVHIPYFAIVMPRPETGLGLLIVATIGLIILLTAFHVANALMTKSIRTTGATPRPDELDRLIEYRAAKVAAFVLACVVMTWILIAVAGLPGLAGEDSRVALTPILLAVQWLYAGFVVANLAYYGLIVGGYRRMAHG